MSTTVVIFALHRYLPVVLGAVALAAAAFLIGFGFFQRRNAAHLYLPVPFFPLDREGETMLERAVDAARRCPPSDPDRDLVAQYAATLEEALLTPTPEALMKAHALRIALRHRYSERGAQRRRP